MFPQTIRCPVIEFAETLGKRITQCGNGRLAVAVGAAHSVS